MRLNKSILISLALACFTLCLAQPVLAGIAGCQGDPIACFFLDLDPKIKGSGQVTLEGIIHVYWEPLYGDSRLGNTELPLDLPDCWNNSENPLGCDLIDLSYPYFNIELNIGKDKVLYHYEANLSDVACTEFDSGPPNPSPQQYCQCRVDYALANQYSLPVIGFLNDPPQPKVPVCAIADTDFQGALVRKFMSEKALPHSLESVPGFSPPISHVDFTWTRIKSISWDDINLPKHAIFKFQLEVTGYSP